MRLVGRGALLLCTLLVAPVPLFAQTSGAADCGLEQRMSPWRDVCFEPLHSLNVTPASDEFAPVAAVSLFARTGFPSDRDNGGVWAGRGLATVVSAGVGGRLGALRFGLLPEIRWSQNAAFPLADVERAGFSEYAYPWEGVRIDVPERMGPSASPGVGLGQSFVELGGASGVAVGLSTENIWWGRSRRYPLLLGVSAGGFPHLYGQSPSLGLGPVRATVRVVLGRLTESDYFDDDADNDHDLLTALRFEVSVPSIPGARFAVTSIARHIWDDRLALSDLTAVVPRSTAQDADDLRVDGIAAVTASLPIPAAGSTLHASWGRGDFFVDFEDLVTEPDHAQFWNVGLRRDWFDPGSRRWTLAVEHASTAGSSTRAGRRNPVVSAPYRHSVARHGHTHRGQLLGASIGPGSRATYVSLDRAAGSHLVGILVERVLWDIDAYRRSDLSSRIPDGQDREWLFAGRVARDVQLLGVERLRLTAFGGLSLRWNRQYVRFTGDNLDLAERDTSFWLDLRFAWTPRADPPGA